MKKSVLFLTVAMATTSVLFSSCKKDDNDVEDIKPISVFAPIIAEECTDMLCWNDKTPNVISWTEPEVTGNFRQYSAQLP